MNLSEAKGTGGHYDFSRVESLILITFKTGACPKKRQNVVMTMFSGKSHTWGEYVENPEGAERQYKNLLAEINLGKEKS